MAQSQHLLASQRLGRADRIRGRRARRSQDFAFENADFGGPFFADGDTEFGPEIDDFPLRRHHREAVRRLGNACG